jgi:hypothetical protein
VSVGPAIAVAAYELAATAATEILTAGTYATTEARLSYDDLNALA